LAVVGAGDGQPAGEQPDGKPATKATKHKKHKHKHGKDKAAKKLKKELKEHRKAAADKPGDAEMPDAL